jgi:threonyl-tRNA synthetase
MQNPFMLIVGEEEEKTALFLSSSWTEGKGNITVTIEEFAAIVTKRSKKH